MTPDDAAEDGTLKGLMAALGYTLLSAAELNHLMASAPLRLCSTPGCPQRVAGGHCQAHRQAQKQQYSRFYAGGGFYGRPWRRAADVFLGHHPLCIDCGRMATEVDHVIPHRGDQALFWDESNWAPRCKPCHSSKTAREVGWQPRGGA